ncbi:MAG: polymer-forming cytoskeletal protein [Candidatus Heimdallarchaeota archaeon]
MRKFGPRVFQQDYKNREEDISSFGPTIAKGNLTIRSVKAQGPLDVNGILIAEEIKTNGPVDVEGDLTADFIKTNGPLDVGGSLTAQEIKVNGPAVVNGPIQIVLGRINGPLRAQQNVRADDSLKVNGPLEAKTLDGGVLRISGSVVVEGAITATDEVAIGISPKSEEDPIQAALVKAPFVEIRTRGIGFLGRFFSRFTSRRSITQELAETAVPIEADEVTLDGVRHTGPITAKNIILENEAEHVGERSR